MRPARQSTASSVDAPPEGCRLHVSVLDAEPGLYFQPDDLSVPEEYRGIGVRIEDNILVTADGAENLSAGIPRTADAVEAWMRSR